MSYFWLNLVDLEPGSVVNPGTWYRVKLHAPLDAWYMVEREYEDIRAAEFPSMPSRQKSLFLFDNEAKAKEFRDRQRRSDILYEVEIIDDEAPVAALDMGVVLHNSDYPAGYHNQARQYWSSAGNEETHNLTEIVTESKIKIIRKLQLHEH